MSATRVEVPGGKDFVPVENFKGKMESRRQAGLPECERKACGQNQLGGDLNNCPWLSRERTRLTEKKGSLPGAEEGIYEGGAEGGCKSLLGREAAS